MTNGELDCHPRGYTKSIKISKHGNKKDKIRTHYAPHDADIIHKHLQIRTRVSRGASGFPVQKRSSNEANGPTDYSIQCLVAWMEINFPSWNSNSCR
jgi:hypothetical protein